MSSIRLCISTKTIKLWQRIGAIICFLCFTSVGAVFAEEAATVEYQANDDKTILSIPLGAGNVEGVKSLVERLKSNNTLNNVTALVVNIKGSAPNLILTGSDPDELDKALKLFQMFFSEATKQKPIIVITASLKELSEQDFKAIGLKLLPNTINGEIKREWYRDKQSVPDPDPDTPDMTSKGRNSTSRAKDTKDYYLADDVVTGNVSVGDDGNGGLQEILELNNNDDKGKTLVASEIYTTNGVQGQLANIHNRPYRTINSNGSIDIRYQELKTDIKITPTIVKYNTEKPEESRVKLDVELEVGAFVNVAVSGSL